MILHFGADHKEKLVFCGSILARVLLQNFRDPVENVQKILFLLWFKFTLWSSDVEVHQYTVLSLLGVVAGATAQGSGTLFVSLLLVNSFVLSSRWTEKQKQNVPF